MMVPRGEKRRSIFFPFFSSLPLHFLFFLTSIFSSLLFLSLCFAIERLRGIVRARNCMRRPFKLAAVRWQRYPSHHAAVLSSFYNESTLFDLKGKKRDTRCCQFASRSITINSIALICDLGNVLCNGINLSSTSTNEERCV